MGGATLPFPQTLDCLAPWRVAGNLGVAFRLSLLSLISGRSSNCNFFRGGWRFGNVSESLTVVVRREDPTASWLSRASLTSAPAPGDSKLTQSLPELQEVLGHCEKMLVQSKTLLKTTQQGKIKRYLML